MIREVNDLDKDTAEENITYKLGNQYYIYDAFINEFFMVPKPESRIESFIKEHFVDFLAILLAIRIIVKLFII